MPINNIGDAADKGFEKVKNFFGGAARWVLEKTGSSEEEAKEDVIEITESVVYTTAEAAKIALMAIAPFGLWTVACEMVDVVAKGIVRGQVHVVGIERTTKILIQPKSWYSLVIPVVNTNLESSSAHNTTATNPSGEVRVSENPNQDVFMRFDIKNLDSNRPIIGSFSMSYRSAERYPTGDVTQVALFALTLLTRPHRIVTDLPAFTHNKGGRVAKEAVDNWMDSLQKKMMEFVKKSESPVGNPLLGVPTEILDKYQLDVDIEHKMFNDGLDELARREHRIMEPLQAECLFRLEAQERAAFVEMIAGAWNNERVISAPKLKKLRELFDKAKVGYILRFLLPAGVIKMELYNGDDKPAELEIEQVFDKRSLWFLNQNDLDKPKCVSLYKYQGNWEAR